MPRDHHDPIHVRRVAGPVFSDPEQFARAVFLAGYRGGTRDAYALDLRQFVAWCDQHDLHLFDVRRADIECFARDLEERGRSRATVGRRLSTIVGFYRHAEEEGLLAHSPAANVRRARLEYESHAVGLDRNEVGALLVAAGLARHNDGPGPGVSRRSARVVGGGSDVRYGVALSSPALFAEARRCKSVGRILVVDHFDHLAVSKGGEIGHQL